jgi:HAD superfamily hydrolase (TIGR01509 family)
LPAQAILFDFMGVLLFRRDAYTPDAVVDAVDERIGRVTDDGQFRREVMQTYRLTKPEFDGLLARVAAKYVPYEPLWRLLPRLRQHYKLGIINNGTCLSYPLFNARLELDRAFDLFLSSAQEGVAKPAAEIFERACERLAVMPGQCLFMDDAEANVRGACQAGMRAIHWPDRDSGFQAFGDWLKSENTVG